MQPVQTLTRWSPAFRLDETEIPDWLKPGAGDFDALGIRIPKELLYFHVVQYEGIRYGVLSPIAKNLNWVLSDRDPGTSTFRQSILKIARSMATDRIRDLAKMIMKPGVYDPDIPHLESPYPTIMAPVSQRCQGVLTRHPIYDAVPVEVIPTHEDAIIVADKAVVERLGGDLDGDLYGVLAFVDGLLCDYPVPEVKGQEIPEVRGRDMDEELQILHSRLLSRQVGQPTLAAYQSWSTLRGADLRYSVEAWNKTIREIFDQKHNGPTAGIRPRPKPGVGSALYRYLYDRNADVTVQQALDEFMAMIEEEVENA